MSHKQEKILGILIPVTNRTRVLKQAQKFISTNDNKLKNSTPKVITTPNPEILLLAKKSNKYRTVINNADMKIPDGIGLAIAVKLREISLKPRLLTIATRLFYLPVLYFSTFLFKDWLTTDFKIYPGRKMFEDIIKIAQKENKKVFLFGSRGDVIDKCIKKIKTPTYSLIRGSTAPELDVSGYPKSKEDDLLNKKIIREINEFKPDILFVGIEPPKQELWTDKNKNKINAKLVACVGGTFDYFAGQAMVPPGVFEKNNLEWLWRLLTQPKRIRRIFRAVVVFPFSVVFE